MYETSFSKAEAEHYVDGIIQGMNNVINRLNDDLEDMKFNNTVQKKEIEGYIEDMIDLINKTKREILSKSFG